MFSGIFTGCLAASQINAWGRASGMLDGMIVEPSAIGVMNQEAFKARPIFDSDGRRPIHW